MSIEEQIISCLRNLKTSYTKDIYNYCGGKQGTQLSLNKFRKILENMHMKNTIQYIVSEYPCWVLTKEVDQ